MKPRMRPDQQRQHTLPALCLAFAIAWAFPVKADEAAHQPRATFERVWEKLRESSFDQAQGTVDWAGLEARHRPRIEKAPDLPTLRSEIVAMLDAVGVSHLSLIPAEAIPAEDENDWNADAEGESSDMADETSPDRAGDDGKDKDAPALSNKKSDKADRTARAAPRIATIGMRTALVGGVLRVTRVDPGSAADQAGLRPGLRILWINGIDVGRALRDLQQQPAGKSRQRAELQLQMSLNDRLNDLPEHEPVVLRVQTDDGAKTHLVTAKPKQGIRIAMMPGMPAQILAFEAQRVPLPGRGCALRVRFDLWAQPVYDRLAQTLREQPDCDRLILDLRGNPGGQMWTLGAVAGLFFEQKTSLGTMDTLDGKQKLAVLPRRVTLDGSLQRRLQGPLAVLVDRGSASCSEIFAGGMQALGRARVFGETSAGMALPAITARLPSGDWLYYPTADVVDPKGRRIEGLGVVPDQAIELTGENLAKGGDPAMDAALAWISAAE